MAYALQTTGRRGGMYLSRDFLVKVFPHWSFCCAQIWTLPKLTLAFSTTAIASLQTILVDSFDPPALSLPQDPPRKPQELDIEQILISPIGETDPWPYLLVLLFLFLSTCRFY
jgi:hypothetical protein